MELKERTKVFIQETGVPLSKFAERVGLSRPYVYKWLTTAMPISTKAMERIDCFLKQFNH